MTIPTDVVGPGLSMPPNGGGMESLVSQNLFEHFARQAGTNPVVTTPAEFGSSVLQALEGPIEQVQNFSHQLRERPGMADFSAPGGEAHKAGDHGLEDGQFDRMLDSFSTLFDYATLMKLMSSGASQTSGACKTLLRGQ